jgi:ankyrin repeat protein
MKRVVRIVIILIMVIAALLLLGLSTQRKSGLLKQFEIMLILGDRREVYRMVWRRPDLLFVWKNSKQKADTLRKEFGQAIHDNDGDKVRLLVQQAPPLLEAFDTVALKDRGGKSALHTAVALGNLNVVKILIELGANPKTRESDGKTPLHNCTSPEIAELLLAHGAEINARDSLGQSPLLLTTFKDRVEMLRVLVAHGADTNLKANDGAYPLALTDNAEIRQLLLQHGAKE